MYSDTFAGPARRDIQNHPPSPRLRRTGWSGWTRQQLSICLLFFRAFGPDASVLEVIHPRPRSVFLQASSTIHQESSKLGHVTHLSFFAYRSLAFWRIPLVFSSPPTAHLSHGHTPSCGRGHGWGDDSKKTQDSRLKTQNFHHPPLHTSYFRLVSVRGI